MIGITEIPPGAIAWSFFFSTQDPATGSQGAPDVISVRMFATDGASRAELTNGVDLDWSVTSLDTGVYALDVDVSVNAYYPGAVITAMAQTQWGELVQVAPIVMFSLGPPVVWASVVADAGNTSSTFKIAVTPDNLPTGTNMGKNTLVVPIKGDIVGEGPRKITAYNVGTGFVTVDPAFESVPQANDRFIYVFR